MSASNQLGRKRSTSGPALPARERASSAQEYPVPTNALTTMVRHFEPSAATAGMFLYAQGSSIVCCHHDTLTIERRFSQHPDDIQLLAVDNMSERGAGRLVVSYDAGQNAIVWDIVSGAEVARFTSFSNLTAVAWMHNGTVAFGNESGTIILFEPETSEHISFRTIDQIPVTALAPAADCRTFAIGYQNGSLLICNLQPRFTILHNLSTSRGPSPIVNLAWHASSTRQRSDMLAVQTYDGDLRVWSVAKAHHSSDPAKVVRILKRSDDFVPGPNWMSWSKNGRIIQFSEGETISWDVRTKHVTYDSIPTLETVRGLAVYGPGAILFTMGANNTVQQFDLNAPAMMVVDVQHPANLLPPSPPISVEEQVKVAAAAAAAAAAEAAGSNTGTTGATTTTADSSASDSGANTTAANTSESEISIHLDGVSESDEDRMSPFARMVQAQTAGSGSDLARTLSPVSSNSHISSQSSRSGNVYRYQPHYQTSVQSMSNVSRGVTETTPISIGSSVKSSAFPIGQPAHHHSHSHGGQPRHTASTLSGTGTGTTGSSFSIGANHRHTMSRPSRLRNEIPRSPDDAKVHDLFKFTRSRLSDIPYRMPPPPTGARLTNDDLRRQMLSTIFGWSGDIKDLVRDEMSHHPTSSANRILLAKWLGDIDMDIMVASSESMTSSDWMLLALSGIGSQASQHKLGRAYIQRLLESGDLHAAATIMIGMGDYLEAIEIYVSYHKYMEALLVACLFYPAVWERQSHLLWKWSRWAVNHGQEQLAIRCHACLSQESTEPWTSPSAVQINFPSIQGVALPEVLSPPLSPPHVRGPQRSIAKTSALKLITNFTDDNVPRAKFYSGGDGDGATPLAAGVTPILDSAISPGIGSTEATTALLRPTQRSAFNTPNSARGPGSAFGRQRLPSIGETPSDANHPRSILKERSASVDLPTPSVDKREAGSSNSPHGGAPGRADGNYAIGMALQRASTSSPLYVKKDKHVKDRQPKDKQAPPPSPSPASMAVLLEGQAKRNGSRTRIPTGVQLQIDPADKNALSTAVSPDQSATSSNRYRWPSRRRGPASVSSSLTSNSSAYLVRNNRFRTNDVPNASKTLDEYINSLEAAKSRARVSSRERERRQRSRDASRKTTASSVTSGSGAPTLTPASRAGDSVAGDDRSWAPSRGYPAPKSGAGKRSPRSPVPMSPEDLINLSTSTPAKMFSRDKRDIGGAEADAALATVRKAASQPASRVSSKSRPTSRASSRGRGLATDRQADQAVADGRGSPDRRPPAVDISRGRKTTRTSSAMRSPSSPLPFSSEAAQYYASEEDDEDYKKAMVAKEQFRSRDRAHERSSSRGRHGRGTSPASSQATKIRDRSHSRRRKPTPTADATAGGEAVGAVAGAAAGSGGSEASYKKERIAAGPPPAPSAVAVASGMGIDWGSAAFLQDAEELGRKRTSSAQSNLSVTGDLKQLSKDERAQRKAAAARELEERRKSLVRRPLAPAVMHPDEILPGQQQYQQQLEMQQQQQSGATETVEHQALEQSQPPHDVPARSQSTEPGAKSKAAASRAHSMFATRGPVIGLPATPKAMRLVMESGVGSLPSIPPLPLAYTYKRSPTGSGETSPSNNAQTDNDNDKAGGNKSSKEQDHTESSKATAPSASGGATTATAAPAAQEETLAILPSTVYQPPAPHRSAIPRSMSAPPQELVAFSGLSRSKTPSRAANRGPKLIIPDTDARAPVQVSARESSLPRYSRRPSADESDVLPPPPPPMLKELAHLAMPPPPPPAPLPFAKMDSGSPVSYSNYTTSSIEVVMDDGQVRPIMTMSPPPTRPPSMLPPPPPPLPPIPGADNNAGSTSPQSRSGHNRGRSSTDNSIAGRISRATERMRSVSRSRNNNSTASRTKSPESTFAPYESIPVPGGMSPEVLYSPYESVPKPLSFPMRGSPQQQQQQQQQLQQEQQSQLRTGLHHSEMI